MYNLQTYAQSTIQRAIGSILLVVWFIVINSVVLNIFIVIIEHALLESPDSSRKHQLKNFMSDITMRLLEAHTSPGYLRLFKEKIFKNKEEAVDTTMTHMLLTDTAVNKFINSKLKTPHENIVNENFRSDYYVIRVVDKMTSVLGKPFQNPFYALKIEVSDTEVFDPARFAA